MANQSLKTFLLPLLLSAPALLTAQSSDAWDNLSLRHWAIGPVAGLDFNSPAFGSPSARTGTGFIGGVHVERHMRPMFGPGRSLFPVAMGQERSPLPLLPVWNLVFEIKGVGKSFVYGGGDGGPESNVDFLCIEAPLLLKAGFSLGQVGAHVLAGPMLGWLASVEADGSLRNSDFERLDWGGQAGAGLVYLLSPIFDLVADARFTYGFRDMLDERGHGGPDWKSRDVQIHFGFLFYPRSPAFGSNPGSALGQGSR
jgi:hypothetical protein